jgi:hypothetical protein
MTKKHPNKNTSYISIGSGHPIDADVVIINGLEYKRVDEPMKLLRIKSEYSDCDYPSDVGRIVKIFANRGYDISYSEAYIAWRAFSDSMAANWMMLGEEDDEVFYDCFSYFEEV